MGCGGSVPANEPAKQPSQAKIRQTIDQINQVVAAGIKGALNSAIDHACENFSIPLPELIEDMKDKLASVMKVPIVGAKLKEKFDSFSRLLKEAGQAAVPGCKPILHQSVEKLSIKDTRSLFEDKDPAACTKYFQQECEKELITQCMVPVKAVLDKSTVVQAWDFIVENYNKLPGLDPIDFDLQEYVSKQTVLGILKLMQEREAEIRKDPKITNCKAVIDAFGNTTIYHGYDDTNDPVPVGK